MDKKLKIDWQLRHKMKIYHLLFILINMSGNNTSWKQIEKSTYKIQLVKQLLKFNIGFTFSPVSSQLYIQAYRITHSRLQ